MPRRHCRSPVFLGSLIDFGMVMDINHRNVCLHASHPRCWNTGKSPVRLTSRLKLARKGRAVSLCQDLNPESNWSLLPRETSVLFILVVDRSGLYPVLGAAAIAIQSLGRPPLRSLTITLSIFAPSARKMFASRSWVSGRCFCVPCLNIAIAAPTL
jgi:hypothetical protein